MRRTEALTLLAGAAALAGIPAPARAQSASGSLTLALTGRTASAWPTYIATELGLFTTAGVNVDVVVAGSSASGTQQLAAGSADVADVSATQIVQAIAGGAPIKAVFDRTRSAPYYLFGKKGVTSLQQLKGKTMIIGGPNDITRIFTDTIMRNAGLDPDSVAYVYAGGAANGMRHCSRAASTRRSSMHRSCFARRSRPFRSSPTCSRRSRSFRSSCTRPTRRGRRRRARRSSPS
jgi:NitT/TauT family transport system substrate-binding protein